MGQAGTDERAVDVELTAVLTAVKDGQPKVLTVAQGTALPAGPFETGHRSLQAGMRAWVEQQTGHGLGYVEQLYTFADRDRTGAASGPRVISISYLGLTRAEAGDAGWADWYAYFPWEDHRKGPPPVLAETLIPQLQAWAGEDEDRRDRVGVSFGLGGLVWNEELVLQRYELLFEAGLVGEAGAKADRALGLSMTADHRRILATGVARLRAKIKYRPLVFELMPDAFTLLQLQQCVEALAGQRLHKQNFRRLIENQQLVEETGAMTSAGLGRPAKLFRFRRAAMAERAVLGAKPPIIRS